LEGGTKGMVGEEKTKKPTLEKGWQERGHKAKFSGGGKGVRKRGTLRAVN